MPSSEHLHIITAGNDIFPAYVRALRDHDDITGTVIFTDTALFSKTSRDSPDARSAKVRGRLAVSRVRAHAAALKIPVSFEFIDPPVLETVRAALLRIAGEHPGAVFTFDLTGGGKDLSMVLFSLSLWFGATTQYSLPGPGGMEERAEFAAPLISVAAVAANRNYLRVLESLARRPAKAMEDPVTGLSRSYLYNQVAAYYVPKRTRGVRGRAENPGTAGSLDRGAVVQFELTQGTFSNILRTMTAAGLIEVCPHPGADRKRSLYRITAAGDLALRLAQLQSRQPLVT